MIQNRTYLDAEVLTLRTQFEDGGSSDCCCLYPVVADLQSFDTWKNDVTWVWQKMLGNSDTFSINVYKGDELVTYTSLIKAFPNDVFSRHTPVNWRTILSQHGAGCYRIEVDAVVAGTQYTYTWGNYQLLPYAPDTVNATVRLRSYLDSKQSIEGIDFRGSNVFTDIRFKGFFGERNPQTQVDNTFNQNRRLIKIKREHLNQFTLQSNPLDLCFTKPLLDLHLLSENRTLVSDYNQWNHDQGYKDFPCIVQEVGEPTYQRGSSKAVINAVFNNLVQNERSYY